MFPEFRELISGLKSEDLHFAQLFHRHNELDQQIWDMEAGLHPTDAMAMEKLKKEKLLLKDRILLVLRKAAAARNAGSDSEQQSQRC